MQSMNVMIHSALVNSEPIFFNKWKIGFFFEFIKVCLRSEPHVRLAYLHYSILLVTIFFLDYQNLESSENTLQFYSVSEIC